MSIFDRTYCINLPERVDRRSEFEKQIALLGSNCPLGNVSFFPAIRPESAAGFPSKGAHGCFLSHLSILETASELGVDTLLVCEDDLNLSKNFCNRFSDVLEYNEKSDWDMLYLGHEGIPEKFIAQQKASVFSVPPDIPIVTSHFIAFRKSIISELVNFLKGVLNRAPGHPDGGPMHIDGAYYSFRRARTNCRVRAVNPPLGYQRPSRTDIHKLQFYDRLPVMRSLTSMLRKVKNTSSNE